MPSERNGPAPTIAAELLVSTALLFGAALLVGILAGALLFPFLQTTESLALFLALILVADLAILFLFLRYLLNRAVFGPLDRIGEHAEKIASGDYEHRIPEVGRMELDRLVGSMNTMAERLIRDQKLLEENVHSLERTNRELVETSDELVRTARMASVGTLAAGIAHEVGNPLGALRTSLDVAHRRASRGGDVDEAVEMALEEARRIDAIIQSILEFVRSREDPDAWETVDPVERVRAAVDLLERRGALDDVEVRVQEEGEVPGVLARPQLVEQVLVNLLMNAAKAVAQPARRDDEAPSERAHIEVRIRGEGPPTDWPAPRREDDPPGADYSHRRRLALLKEGRRAAPVLRVGPDAVIEVRDRGPGIPAGDLEQLFDPFFTTHPPGEGTGMGLAITSRIIQELGGELTAENREGGGAVFRMRLPGNPSSGPGDSPVGDASRKDEPGGGHGSSKPASVPPPERHGEKGHGE